MQDSFGQGSQGGDASQLVVVTTIGGRYHTTVGYGQDESVTVVTDGPLSQEHYSLLVAALVRARYSADDEFAIARQCYSDVEGYREYGAFVERCKEMACKVLGMDYVPDFSPSMAEVMTQLRILLKPSVEGMEDGVAAGIPALFDPWAVGVAVAVGERRYYGGKLYRCVQAHTTQADWTPDVTPALWTEVSVEEWPEWRQPAGAHDAYSTGDRVTYGGRRYVSKIDGNVWSPEAYPAGWEEQM